MKQLTCEICGGNDLIKQDGVFVCQFCGCKYSLEEAKKMMIEGTVEVSGTVKVDDTAKIDNYLELSSNAYNSGNGQSAFEYANKALEIAPKNPKAWIAKMKSIEHIGTFGNPKLMEVIEAGKNAIAFADESQKNEITYEVYFYEVNRALELLKLGTSKLLDTASIKNTFNQFCRISIFSAGTNTLNADKGVVSMYDNLATESLALILLVPDQALADFSKIANLVKEWAKQYQLETNALEERYKIYGAKLLDSAKTARKNNIKTIEEKCNRALKISADRKIKEQAERNKQYWAEHSEERKKYNLRLTEINSEINELDKQYEAFEPRISAIKEDTKQVLSAEKEMEEIIKQQSDLDRQKSKLGIFALKQKKQIQEQIDNLQLQINRYAETIKDQKKAISDDITARISAVENERKPIKDRIVLLQKEKNNIQNELTKNR